MIRFEKSLASIVASLLLGATATAQQKSADISPLDLVTFAVPVKSAHSFLRGTGKPASDLMLFNRCMELAKGGVITVVDQARGITGKGRSKSVVVHSFPAEYDLDEEANRRVPAILDTREVGSIFGSAAARDLETNRIELQIGYEHHYAKPLEREVSLLWKGSRKPKIYAGVETDYYTENLASQLVVDRPGPILLGISRPPARGESVPDSGKFLHVTFIKPGFEAKEIQVRKPHSPGLAAPAMMENFRFDAVVIAVPDELLKSFPQNPDANLDGGDFLKLAMESVSGGGSQLVTVASITTSSGKKADISAVREFVHADQVEYHAKTEKSSPIPTQPMKLGTIFEVAQGGFSKGVRARAKVVSPKADIDCSVGLSFQIAEPLQVPLDAKKMPKGNRSVPVEYKYGTQSFGDSLVLESGVAYLIPEGAGTKRTKTAEDLTRLIFITATRLPSLPAK